MPEQAPRVLGVEDFVFRKGKRYGTVLADVETGRVVDVLSDREGDTFAAWRTAHRGAEIICRDRATAYSKAIKEAAPDALEVADRRHLPQNLGNRPWRRLAINTAPACGNTPRRRRRRPWRRPSRSPSCRPPNCPAPRSWSGPDSVTLTSAGS
ncbi:MULTISPECIES: transposase [unclassified Streptomyces]|uniref:transposase n=1 Tax=unclassified Streptomyces TaxID=2593676 RepID=UPI0033F679D6